MELTREYIKEKLVESKKLIEKNGKLEIIYMRVSTKNKGQKEEDQLKGIVEAFDVNPKNCLIIKAKESAFKIEKQKKRLLNVIPIISKRFIDVQKIVYVWDLDRLYRRWRLQAEFIKSCAKYNCQVISYRQEFLYTMKDQVKNGLGEVFYNFFTDMFGWIAEQESKKKRDRVLKSLTQKEGVTYTNKGNIFGRRIVKSVSSKGKKIYFTKEEVDKIEKIIVELFKKNKTYDYIEGLLDDNGIKISHGFLAKVKKKHISVIDDN